MQNIKEIKLAFSIGRRLIADGKLTKNMKRPRICEECPLDKAAKALGHIDCKYFNILVLGEEVESKINTCTSALELVYEALALKKAKRYLKI